MEVTKKGMSKRLCLDIPYILNVLFVHFNHFHLTFSANCLGGAVKDFVLAVDCEAAELSRDFEEFCLRLVERLLVGNPLFSGKAHVGSYFR